MKKIFALIVFVTLIFSIAYAGTMSELSLIRDNRGVPTGGLVTTGYVDAVVLTTNVAQTYTVPSGANYLRFSGNADFYVNIGGTATVPSVTTATGASNMLIKLESPAIRSVSGNTSVSVIAPATTIVTIEAFK